MKMRRRNRRRKSRRKRSRMTKAKMLTTTQRVRSAIFIKQTELTPSAVIVQMTTSQTAPWTRPSRKMTVKMTATTTSQMLRMTMIMKMKIMKVTWRRVKFL